MRRVQRSLAVGSLLVACGCWHAEIAKDDLLRPPGPPMWTADIDEEPGARPPSAVPVINDLFVDVQQGPVALFIRRGAPRQAFIPDRAVLRVDLPAGHATAPGVAAVLAHAVAELPIAPGSSLSEALHTLGGELRVRVGLETASFTATVPVKEWASALRIMTTALKQLHLTRDQLVRLKSDAIQRELASRAVSPMLSLVGYLLRTGVADPNPVLDHLQDCALPQLMLLHARYYQPRNMLIGLWVPGADQPEAIKKAALEALNHWRPADPVDQQAAKSAPPPRPAIPSGIHWIEGPGPSRVALVLPAAAGAELQVLQEVLTLDGVGGRLGEHLRRALGFEPAFRAHHIGSLRQRFLVLDTTVQPDMVIPLWRALEQARVSLVQEKPQGLELKVGIDRARLLLLARDAEPDAWFEAAAVRVLGRQNGGPAEDFAALERLHAGQIALELGAFVRQAPLMVVLGGTPPDNAGAIITKGSNMLARTRIEDTQRSPAEQEVEARKHLDNAVRALGGIDKLRLLQGFCAKARRWIESGPQMTEETWYRMPDRVRRVAKVLSTEIETIVHGDQGTERSGIQEKRLSPGDSMNAWLEPARHPLTLLAEYARGNARYHLVGVRRIAGRDLAILERVGASQLRLRLLIDAGSGLPRVVDSWERRSGVGLVEVRERYQDYRAVDGIRIPHHRETVLNDTEPVIETLWETFVPKAPDDSELKAGGR